MAKVLEITEQNFPEEVLKSKVPVLVDFYAPWCLPCKTLEPIIDQVANKLPDQAKIVKVNIDQQAKLAAANQVRGLPTMMIFKNGQPIHLITNVPTVDDIVSKLI